MESLKIDGMHCKNCTNAVEKALNAIDGISQVEVSLDAGEARFKNSGVSTEVLQKAIEEIGFDVV